MATQRLTSRQQALLDFVRATVHRSGRPPTRAEIAAALHLKSTSTAWFHLEALARKGYVRLLPGTSRGIELLGGGNTVPEDSLPLIGRVPAGVPLEAVEHVDGPLNLRDLFPKADYLLRVHGESMKGAGILDGDLIAVQRVEEARHGDIVVARLNNEDTVKRLHCRDGTVLLVPENQALAPIAVDPARDDFAIDGIVIGVIRTGLAP